MISERPVVTPEKPMIISHEEVIPDQDDGYGEEGGSRANILDTTVNK